MSVSNYLIPENLTNNSNLYVNNLYTNNIILGIQYFRQLLPYSSPNLTTNNYYSLIGSNGVGSRIIPFSEYKNLGSMYLITNSGYFLTVNALTTITIKLLITGAGTVVANFVIPASSILTDYTGYEAKIKLIFYDLDYTSQPISVAVGAIGYLNVGSNNLAYISSVEYLLLTSSEFKFDIQASFSTISVNNQFKSLTTLIEKI